MSKISEMISAYGDKAEGLQNSIANLNEQITDLQEQRDEVYNMMNTVESEQDDLLINKRDNNSWEFIWKGSSYGSTDVSNWKIANAYESFDTIELSASDAFILSPGDFTADFTGGSDLLIDCGVDGIKYCIVDYSVYVAIEDQTQIKLTSGSETITNNIQDVGFVVYVYEGVGWDNDSDIQQRIDEFEFMLDHITKPLDSSGTYGLDDSISQLKTGRSLLQANRDKYKEAADKYERFA